METLVTLSIIIVNYNSNEFLLKCVESIYRSVTRLHFEIILVDNHSSEPPLRFNKKNLITIINGENVGFAAANNQGIKRAKGRYVLLLNPDTVLLGDAVHRMVRFLEKNNKVGVVGSRILNPDRTLQPSCKNFPSMMNIFLENSGLYTILPFRRVIGKYYYRMGDFQEPTAVDSVLGACLMVKREILREVGTLDEKFFMYGEEVDFCKRVKDAGWEVIYHPEAEIIHWGGGSSGQNFRANLIEQHRARCLYMKKHFNGLKVRIGTWMIVFGLIGRVAAGFIPGMKEENNTNLRIRNFLQVLRFYLAGEKSDERE
jgi:GT2 family glycosyltransferase